MAELNVKPEIFIARPEIMETQYPLEEMETIFRDIFTNLSQKNVSKFVKQKQGLDYLPWSDCYDILMSEYPSAQYHTYWFPDSNGQWSKCCSEIKGYTVQVGITIKGIHKFSELPIWSGRPPKAIIAPDSMDVNNSLKRCGVKAAAMFGLALYLYQGEDSPQPNGSKNIQSSRSKNIQPKVSNNAQPPNLDAEKTLDEVAINTKKELIEEINKSGETERIKTYLTKINKTSLAQLEIPKLQEIVDKVNNPFLIHWFKK